MTSEYPEHEKLAKISDKSQAIGEFLSWLSQQGFYICQWQDKGDNGQPRFVPATEEEIEQICVERGRGAASQARRIGIPNPNYESWPSGYFPSGRQIIDYLAEYFGIDQDKIDAEKRAMLQKLRSAYDGEGASDEP